MQKGIGWRKALRAAIADNPFVKDEGLSPKVFEKKSKSTPQQIVDACRRRLKLYDL